MALGFIENCRMRILALVVPSLFGVVVADVEVVVVLAVFVAYLVVVEVDPLTQFTFGLVLRWRREAPYFPEHGEFPRAQ